MWRPKGLLSEGGFGPQSTAEDFNAMFEKRIVNSCSAIPNHRFNGPVKHYCRNMFLDEVREHFVQKAEAELLGLGVDLDEKLEKARQERDEATGPARELSAQASALWQESDRLRNEASSLSMKGWYLSRDAGKYESDAAVKDKAL